MPFRLSKVIVISEKITSILIKKELLGESNDKIECELTSNSIKFEHSLYQERMAKSIIIISKTEKYQ